MHTDMSNRLQGLSRPTPQTEGFFRRMIRIALSISPMLSIGPCLPVGSPPPDGGTPVATGSCESTCDKAIAAQCGSTPYDMAGCLDSCAKQEASCQAAGQADDFQTYLDCIESTPMTCGTTLDTPTSPDCVQQGLMIAACALNAGGTGGGGGGGNSCKAGTADADAECVASGMPAHMYQCVGQPQPDPSCVMYHDYGAGVVAWCCP